MTEREKHDDEALWRQVAQTVKPLAQDRWRAKTPSKPRAESPPKPESSPELPPESPLVRVIKPPPSKPPKPPHQPADLRDSRVSGISRADARRMMGGDIAVTARLDLHGETIDGAYAALTRFIAEKQRQHHRYVLVITGKGMAGRGVLRTAFPHWLTAPPLAQAVVAFHPAQTRHGGGGAWYVQLRRLGRLS